MNETADDQKYAPFGEEAEDSSRRQCGPLEYFVRRVVSGVFYFRLYRRLHPDCPYYTPRAVRRVQGLLSRQSKVFEWGSGASTLWYAARVGELISVEHDPTWYERGCSALARTGLSQAKLIFCPPALDPAYDWQRLWPGYARLGHPPRKPEYKDYMTQIDRYPEGDFQVIAIDGRERVGCLLHALPHLAKGGCVILDDSHRPKYAEFFSLLKDWHTEIYDFGLKQTTLFFS
jgi:hypothetical protein